MNDQPDYRPSLGQISAVVSHSPLYGYGLYGVQTPQHPVPLLMQVLIADREFDALFETHNHAAIRLMADAELTIELALMKAAVESRE